MEDRAIAGDVEDWSADHLKRGLRAAWPICIGYFPIGLAFGVLAQKAGLGPMEAGLISVLVFAGSSQFIAVSMLNTGAAAMSIIVTTFMFNLRHVLMSCVIFKIPAANKLPSNSVYKARLIITPVHVLTYDNSQIPVGVDLFKVRKVTENPDLTSPSVDGMNLTLTGDYATVTTQPQWLSGQSSYGYESNSVWYTQRAIPIDPWEIDITTLYNSFSTQEDMVFALECMCTNDKVVTEFFGSHLAALKPYVEVQHYSGGDFQILHKDTG